jgi:uncharacterized damage-inducible protein DinB
MTGWSLFGKKKKEVVPTTQQADEETSQKLGEFQKRIDHLQRQSDELDQQARDFMKKKQKQKAIESMKRKKVLTNQMSNIQNMMFSLEKQRFQIQTAVISVDAINLYSRNINTIKNQIATVDMNKVENLIDEMEDAQDAIDRIQEVFGQTDSTLDEDAQADLESLMAQSDDDCEQPVANLTGKRQLVVVAEEDELCDIMKSF